MPRLPYLYVLGPSDTLARVLRLNLLCRLGAQIPQKGVRSPSTLLSWGVRYPYRVLTRPDLLEIAELGTSVTSALVSWCRCRRFFERINRLEIQQRGRVEVELICK